MNTQILGPAMSEKFNKLHIKYDNVFIPKFHGYKAGDIKGIVNMGPVLPPQRKGRVPQYSRNKLDELQVTIDELEESDIFGKPEDIIAIFRFGINIRPIIE